MRTKGEHIALCVFGFRFDVSRNTFSHFAAEKLCMDDHIILIVITNIYERRTKDLPAPWAKLRAAVEWVQFVAREEDKRGARMLGVSCWFYATALFPVRCRRERTRFHKKTHAQRLPAMFGFEMRTMENDIINPPTYVSLCIKTIINYTIYKLPP
jgi:hypothetical protein